jgi:hypothetical protein
MDCHIPVRDITMSCASHTEICSSHVTHGNELTWPVCCRVLPSVAECCSVFVVGCCRVCCIVLQCVVVAPVTCVGSHGPRQFLVLFTELGFQTYWMKERHHSSFREQSKAVCCSVLQCVAECCSMLQCVHNESNKDVTYHLDENPDTLRIRSSVRFTTRTSNCREWLGDAQKCVCASVAHWPDICRESWHTPY